MAIVPAAQLAAAKQRQAASSYVGLMPGTRLTPPKPVPKIPTTALKTIPSDAASSLVPKTLTPSGASTIGLTANQAAAGTGAAPFDYQAEVQKYLNSVGLGSVDAAVPPTDYQGELKDQPDYQSGQTLFTNTQDAAARAKQMAIRQAIISSGLIPDSGNVSAALQPYLGEVDQATIDTARGNQFSTQAQLQRGLSDASAALPYQLAARGMESSGEAIQRGTQLNRDYDLQTNQNLSSLLSVLSGTEGDYGNAITSARSQWEQTQRDIAARLAQTQGYSQRTPNIDLAALLRSLGLGGDGADTGGGAPPPDPNNPNLIPPTPQRPYVPPTPSPAILKALNTPGPVSGALARAKAAAQAGYISVPVSSITQPKKKKGK